MWQLFGRRKSRHIAGAIPMWSLFQCMRQVSVHVLRIQAVLAGLERPLLCSSVHVEAGVGALELPEAAVMLDMFEPRGIDFVVDAGVTARALYLQM